MLRDVAKPFGVLCALQVGCAPNFGALMQEAYRGTPVFVDSDVAAYQRTFTGEQASVQRQVAAWTRADGVAECELSPRAEFVVYAYHTVVADDAIVEARRTGNVAPVLDRAKVTTVVLEGRCEAGFVDLTQPARVFQRSALAQAKQGYVTEVRSETLTMFEPTSAGSDMVELKRYGRHKVTMGHDVGSGHMVKVKSNDDFLKAAMDDQTLQVTYGRAPTAMFRDPSMQLPDGNAALLVNFSWLTIKPDQITTTVLRSTAPNGSVLESYAGATPVERVALKDAQPHGEKVVFARTIGGYVLPEQRSCWRNGEEIKVATCQVR